MTGSKTRDVVFKNNSTNSHSLFAGSNAITILHNGEEYKLKITGNGKLILTK